MDQKEKNKSTPPAGAGGHSMRVAEKPKDLNMTGKMAVEYSKTHGKELRFVFIAILLALFFAIGSSVLALVGPGQLSKITDLITQGIGKSAMGIASGIDINAVLRVCYFLVAIHIASALLAYFQGFIMATVTQRITKKLREDVSIKINKLPIWFFNKTSHGDVLSRVTNDVDTIGQTLNQSLGSLVSDSTLLFGSLIMMYFTNWIMATVALVSTVIGMVLTVAIISKSQKYFVSQQKYLGQLNGHIEEIYSGQTIVKVYNADKTAKEQFGKINSKLTKVAFKAQFISGAMMPLNVFIGNLAYATVCVTGAMLAFNGNIDYGVIVAFMVYIRMFTLPLSSLSQVATSLQSTAAAGERVFEFLKNEEMEDESQKTKKLENVKGKVEFKNVRFGYEDSDQIIIKDFSATANVGQKIAIVGPTGAGKTTMVNLLMRFHEIKSGEILIDDTPISQVTRENVHEQFCMVLQDTWLFEGTIRENIVYSKENVTDEQLKEACKAVGIHHFIKTLPDGYDTILSDETSLSSGQKQQITIARAMVQNAPMLILDEATSSVDTRTELIIQNAMDKLMEGRTSFVIAHRLSTIKNADIILVMKDGDIIESGNHETLLAQNGFYSELYNSQFEVA